MIISHSKKFIFLHGRKTAGSSIGISLMRYLSSGDIARGYVTGGLEAGIFPPDWNKSIYYFQPQDFIKKSPRVYAYRRFLIEQYGVSSTHMSAKEVRNYLGENRWSEYFKFTFERNPFDRIVSFYHWRTYGKSSAPTFNEFVDAFCDGNEAFLKRNNLCDFSNLPFYLIDNQIAVDFIGQYDQLSEDLSSVFEKIGIEGDAWMPSNKSGIRPVLATYAAYATDELTDRLSRAFQREMALFGYIAPERPAL